MLGYPAEADPVFDHAFMDDARVFFLAALNHVDGAYVGDREGLGFMLHRVL